MKRLIITLSICLAFAGGVSDAMAQLALGSFTFNNNQFGNRLIESDGGTFSQRNWLNVVNVNPGNPGYLTGPNVDTGIANIGGSTFPTYTIEYDTPIVNRPGPDLGIIVARFSSDSIQFAVSSDGVDFTPFTLFGPATALPTGVERRYYYGASPDLVFGCFLFVQPVDLTMLGIGEGLSISSVRVTAGNQWESQLDLVRVAGLVPEPSSLALAGLGAAAVAMFRRRR